MTVGRRTRKEGGGVKMGGWEGRAGYHAAASCRRQVNDRSPSRRPRFPPINDADARNAQISGQSDDLRASMVELLRGSVN